MKFSHYPLPANLAKPANPVNPTPAIAAKPPSGLAALATLASPPPESNSGLASPLPTQGVSAPVPPPAKLAKPAKMVVAPSPASDLLQRFNSRFEYLWEVEPAQRAIATMLNETSSPLGIDIETMPKPEWREDRKAGLDPYKADIRLVQIAGPQQTVLVLDFLHLPPALLAPVMNHPLIAHNALFEYRFLVQAGLMPRQLHDSMLLHRVVMGHSRQMDLAHCTQDQFQVKLDKSLQVSDWSLPTLSPAQLEYAALDAVLTRKLGEIYWPMMQNSGQLAAYSRFIRVLPVVAQQMLTGVSFDVTTHQRMLSDWQLEIEPLRESLTQKLQINLNSSAQLAGWLTNNLDAKTLAKWPKTGTGQLSTDADTLLNIKHPALAGLQRYKILGKKISTYGDGYARHLNPVTSRIHADFSIAGTRSGRFSCRNPCLQNPHRDPEFRALFNAPKGRRLVVADYSQVELRIAALMALDAVMLAAYEQGADLHVRTASALSGIPESEVTKAQRQLAKACNFGLIYGMQAKTLAAYAASSYNVTLSHKTALQAHKTFFTAYPGMATWHACTAAYSFHNQTVRTRGGLLRDLGKEKHGWKLTEALNTPVQGSGADCLLEALIALPAALSGLDAHLVNHVHDEIILECAEADAIAAQQALTEAMVKGFQTLFPEARMPGLVEAHVGSNWAEAKG